LNRWREESSTSRRRQLRSNKTDSERVLWYHLGSRQIEGAKFRRQHAIGTYVIDFYCAEKKLAVEVDGDGHAKPPQLKHDENRRAYLEAVGVRVVRFTNLEVLQHIDTVLEEIRRTLTLPSPAAAGEG